jgi:membrane protein implicated in regulation of membrane protease activity
MKQSRIMSMVEAAANVVVGYVLAIATQIVVFPWFGIETGLAEHLTIGLLFLIVSLLRSYLLRRLFERHRALR